MNNFDNTGNSPPETEKSVSSIVEEINTSADFGFGIVTGNQEMEFDDWSLCITLCCCCCCGGGGGSSQIKKVI